jgi:hypothetical protein
MLRAVVERGQGEGACTDRTRKPGLEHSEAVCRSVADERRDKTKEI